MAERFEALTDAQIAFIEAQHLFFVATAPVHGHVNLSPKGMDSLRVVSPTCVRWLNLTGSGNETAAHVAENGRMTLMFCGFERQPLILRLYGTAVAHHDSDPGWAERITAFPDYVGARQIFELRIDLVQTSCGFAVPYYGYEGERETLDKWSRKRGREGVRAYWHEKNGTSLDGRPIELPP